ncbi:UvrD-helicase domain-containing protein [Pseudoalteromonas prydzensis]|uniref:UvrD-helicase domain-containing protein n=1 Tax=Pseudoalteromonas prydzensis TaxID=182141 RepID=UPI003FD011F2
MLVDSAARKSAMKLESKLIKAPAGSGKTGLLTNYYLRLLGLVEHPREIQAMTFTNKAVKELAERVITSIERAKSGVPPTNDFERENYELATKALSNSRTRGWNIEHNVNMLQISTIDSFCKRMLVSNVTEHESQLATKNICSDPYYIYQRAVKETLDLLSNEQHGASIRALLSHFGNKVSKVEKLLIEMLEVRERWIPILFEEKVKQKECLEVQRTMFIEKILYQNYLSLVKEEPEIKRVLANLVNLPIEISDFIKYGFTNSVIEDSKILNYLSKLLLTTAKKPKKKFTKNNGICPSMNKDDKATLTGDLQHLANNCCDDLIALSAIPDPTFKDSEWQLLKATFDVLPLLLANLTLTFKEVGEVDFTEITLNAIRSLDSESGQNTSTAIIKSQMIKHILVDEFQDSDDNQLLMLKLLTDSWAEEDLNTLFLVGDAMQSLYGFRGANVTGFMEAEKGIGNQKLSTLVLETNFRSTFGVVEWVNDVFSKAFPETNNVLLGACKYQSSTAVKVSGECEAPVQMHGFIDDHDSDAEAQFIVEQVKSISARDPNASIGILGRTRNSLRSTIEALQATDGISANTVKIKKIAKEPICITAISLVRILIDDLDKLAWLTLLNSGLVGMTHREIEKVLSLNPDPYLAVNDDQAVSLFNDDTAHRFEFVITHINNAIDNKHRQDFDTLLTGLWFQLHGPSLAKNKQDIENVDALFNLFVDVSMSEISLAWLERQLDSLYAKSNSEYISDVEGHINVELMTIHQSKGLEFDYVFIPGMHKRGPSTPSKLLAWSSIGGEDAMGVMACSESVGIKSLDCGYHDFLQKIKQEREQQELIRLVYVAVTRAAKQVFLCGKIGITASDELKIPSNGSMFGVLAHVVNEELVLHESKKNNNLLDKCLISTNVSVIDADINHALPTRNTLAAYRGKQNTTKLTHGIQWSAPVSKIEGVVIHQIIEQINKEGLQNWSALRVDGYSRIILASLKELSLGRDQLITSVNRIKAEIKSLLECEKFKYLSSSHIDDSIEFTMALRKNRVIHMLRVDKGFSTNDGVGHIVNWKSGEMGLNQNTESFIAAQKSAHRDKLKMYAQAYKEVKGNQHVDTMLYFTGSHILEDCG